MRRVPPILTERARAMRADMSIADVRLWSRLRRKQLGVRFLRQLPVGPYILDFACRAAKLAIELDGEQHGMQAEYDGRRDAWLAGQGWRVFRVPVIDAFHRSEDVARTIEAILGELSVCSRPPSPVVRPDGLSSPLPAGGEE